MQNPLARAEHYRKEAAKCHELAKYARPAYLGDFYRRVATRYLSMAEDILRQARVRGDIVPSTSGSAMISTRSASATDAKSRGFDLWTDTYPPNRSAVVDGDSEVKCRTQ
jgi:hypothetical protein